MELGSSGLTSVERVSSGLGGAWLEVTGEGLEPSTNGLTYLIGFRRPSRARPEGGLRLVESLDYPIAIAGVPRLVSGAGAGDPPVPCLLITQSPPFRTVTLAVAGDVVVAGLSGRPSILRHPLVAVRFLPARGSYCLSAGCRRPPPQGRTKRRSPLLYRLSYPVNLHP